MDNETNTNFQARFNRAGSPEKGNRIDLFFIRVGFKMFPVWCDRFRSVRPQLGRPGSVSNQKPGA